MILKNNLLVEELLPTQIMRKLDDEEMANYLEPFKDEGESRRPTLTWPREIPVLSEGMTYLFVGLKNSRLAGFDWYFA